MDMLSLRVKVSPDIASEVAAKGLSFGTDDDADIEVDPLARRYDLTDDPVAYSEDQIQVAERMCSDDTVSTFQSWYPEQGFAPRHKMYRSALRIARNAAKHALSHVGGRVISHAFPSDVNEEGKSVLAPVVPVSASYQRKALRVVERFLATPLYHDPTLLKKLDQQVAYFALAEMEYGLNVPNMRAAFDETVEKHVMAPILSIEKLSRIQISEQATLRGAPVWSPAGGAQLQQDGPKDSVGIYEVLETVTNAVWCQWDLARFRQPHEWFLISTWTRGILALQNRTSLALGASPMDAERKSMPQISTAATRMRMDMQLNLTKSTANIDLTSDPALHAFVDSILQMLSCDLPKGRAYCV